MRSTLYVVIFEPRNWNFLILTRSARNIVSLE
jgi:hypothetical protein